MKLFVLNRFSAYVATLIVLQLPINKVLAQRDAVQIKTTSITQNLTMLEGINGFGGGNVAVLTGAEGTLIVDNMYNWMVPKIDSTIQTLTNHPVNLVINTHYHPDHIAGNITYRKSAQIIAHKNTGNNLSGYADSIKSILMPTVLINTDSTFNFNAETVHLRHFPNSHTSGDLIVYFEKSKTLHLGDIFFHEMFPGIYTKGGGNLTQLLRSLETIIDEYPENTHIIPGHGSLATMSDLRDFYVMLTRSTEIIKKGILDNKTVEDLVQENVLEEYDYLGSGGGQSTTQFINMMYALLLSTSKE